MAVNVWFGIFMSVTGPWLWIMQFSASSMCHVMQWAENAMPHDSAGWCLHMEQQIFSSSVTIVLSGLHSSTLYWSFQYLEKATVKHSGFM